MDHGQRWADSVRAEVSKAVLGQDEVVERLLVAMLADGHVLLEGMPGLAKTLLVRSIGTAMGLQCERVQFTPDLLPSDVVERWFFSPRVVSLQLTWAPSCEPGVGGRDQSRSRQGSECLLEAMQEHQVTIGGESMPCRVRSS